MRILFLLAVVMSLRGLGMAQALYYPPLFGNTWETISPSTLGWCEERIDSLYDLLEENNTKAFIILKDGKIVLEKYFGTFRQDSVWKEPDVLPGGHGQSGGITESYGSHQSIPR